MSFVQMVYLYLLTVPVFFAIDMIWLGVVARDLYTKHIGFLLGPVNWGAAILFYLLFILGILLFSLIPALEKQSLAYALLWGALFGFFTYATYDLTNLATVRNWPLTITLIDIAWGTFLSASVASVSYLLAVRFIV